MSWQNHEQWNVQARYQVPINIYWIKIEKQFEVLEQHIKIAKKGRSIMSCHDEKTKVLRCIQ